jgi:hypothetical protein
MEKVSGIGGLFFLAETTEVRLLRSKNRFPNFGTSRHGAIQSSDSYSQLFGNGPPAKPLAPQV